MYTSVIISVTTTSYNIAHSTLSNEENPRISDIIECAKTAIVTKPSTSDVITK